MRMCINKMFVYLCKIGWIYLGLYVMQHDIAQNLIVYKIPCKLIKLITLKQWNSILQLIIISVIQINKKK